MTWLKIEQSDYGYIIGILNGSPYLKGRYLWQGKDTFGPEGIEFIKEEEK